MAPEASPSSARPTPGWAFARSSMHPGHHEEQEPKQTDTPPLAMTAHRSHNRNSGGGGNRRRPCQRQPEQARTAEAQCHNRSGELRPRHRTSAGDLSMAGAVVPRASADRGCRTPPPHTSRRNRVPKAASARELERRRRRRSAAPPCLLRPHDVVDPGWGWLDPAPGGPDPPRRPADSPEELGVEDGSGGKRKKEGRSCDGDRFLWAAATARRWAAAAAGEGAVRGG